jgi:alpha-tubulin suppressor-like RCC1 family protein
VGGHHACSLTGDGRALCWGRADAGQLGVGDTPLESPVIQSASGETRFASIAAGGLHTCALTEDGQAWCWGANDVGQSGLPAAITQPCGEPIHGWLCVPSPHPLETALRFSVLVAGGGNTCGVAEGGAIYCWGSNGAGQLGAPTGETCDGTPCARTPVALPAEPGLRTLALGSAAHMCGLTADGTAYCWGANGGGELGVGAVGGTHQAPEAVTGGLRFKAIAVGGEHTCAVTTAGAPWCWGRDILPPGDDGVSFSPSPVAIEDSPTFADLITGSWAACGRTAAGRVYCWGINAQGEMGVTPAGLNTRFNTPVEMAGSPRWTRIAGALGTFCGVDAAEDTWCWGHGKDGELGGNQDFSTIPIRIGLP